MKIENALKRIKAGFEIRNSELNSNFWNFNSGSFCFNIIEQDGDAIMFQALDSYKTFYNWPNLKQLLEWAISK